MRKWWGNEGLKLKFLATAKYVGRFQIAGGEARAEPIKREVESCHEFSLCGHLSPEVGRSCAKVCLRVGYIFRRRLCRPERGDVGVLQLDNLIAQGRERGLEYDTLSGKFAEFIQTEVLPAVEQHSGVKFTDDPEGRAVMGVSSGAAAAFTMAWFRNEWYHRVISYTGTFVNQQWPFNPDNPAARGTTTSASFRRAT